jgi:uncharacterized membrane protein YphA (DoxX/SURF4 family)
MTGKFELNRLFHAFPAGRSGLGLLLLRSVIGIVIVWGGGADLMSGSERGILSYTLVSIALLGGVLLMIGLATPVAALIAALEAASMLFPIVPPDEPVPYASILCCFVVTVSAASLVLLGPGAFSLDARLFGWHEVILPPRPPGDSLKDVGGNRV